MDDLISRAAVLDALGECPYNWTDSEAEIAEVCAWESHKSAIENIPTIDAIPVEWLDAQIRGYASALKSTELGALLVVKRLWEKEHEG